MKISVINATQMEYQEVQTVIRAVNRQLQEDFKKYWHKDVELVLEGWTGVEPDPDNPFEIRGEAILYLWDQDDVDGALGYHALTNMGIPFSFVFTQLSVDLDEKWSVTLSHEALEMAVDPEINLLAQGPHPDPDEGGRMVYHWYELCDAVQAQTYTIDDVEVSNFLLPLYFTPGEEQINHNDFLGLGVKSFGVAPGGYVGFYDPLKGGDDQFMSMKKFQKKGKTPKSAEQRQKAKEAYQGGGRSTRRGELRDINNTAQVYCEAIIIEPESPLTAREQKRFIAEQLGKSWKLSEYKSGSTEFDAIYTGEKRLCFSTSWQLVHDLENQEIVSWAEPSFITPVAGESDLSETDTAMRMSSLLGGPDLPGTEDHLWAIKQFKADKAWEFIEANGKKPGDKIIIGHPDSGYLPHKELDAARVNTRQDYDFLDDDADAQTAKGKYGRHGLATASVIMSGSGAENDKVRGPARASTIVPLRVTKPGFLRPTPVLFLGGMRRLRRSIDYATNKGFHIISMSLGGLPSRSVRKAIKRATQKGLIVLAAAGNEVKIVVWPARYSDTIAVAGSNINKEPWSGSSCGSAVDITAGAESMWRASFKNNAQTVGRGHGTSYAVAFTAGAAALWRAFYAEELKGRESEIQELFRAALKASASKDHNLKKGKFGAGLLDCEKLLKQSPEKLQIASQSDSRTTARRMFAKDTDNDMPELSCESLDLEHQSAIALQAILAESDPARLLVRANGTAPENSNINSQVSQTLRKALSKFQESKS